MAEQRVALVDESGLVDNIVVLSSEPPGSVWLCPKCRLQRGADDVVSEEPTCPNCGTDEAPVEVSLAWTPPEGLIAVELSTRDRRRVSVGWTWDAGAGFSAPIEELSADAERALELVTKIDDVGSLSDLERDDALGILLRSSGLIPPEYADSGAPLDETPPPELEEPTDADPPADPPLSTAPSPDRVAPTARRSTRGGDGSSG